MNPKPWITSEIKNLIKIRDKMKRKFIRAKDSNAKERYQNEYKHLRNQIVAMCRECKSQYYNNFFSINANNLKNTWKGINDLIKIKDKKAAQPTSVMVGKELITDP